MAGSTYTQEGRQLMLETPLGKDELLLTNLAGHEEVSRLFSFQLQMLSRNAAISPKDIIGKGVTITLRRPDDSERYFHGVVRQFAHCGTDDRFSHYTAEVVPWLWLLAMKADCRIFQEKTVPQIIEQVFKDLGFSDFETGEIKESHPKWDYCVQYRETDFNFVSRLMEQEGIFYYFRHEKGKHVLVLADQMGAFKDSLENKLEYGAPLGAPVLADNITSWRHRFQIHSGKWAQTDYNFETPSASLMARTNSVVKWQDISNYEIFDYPGEYQVKPKGDAEVKIRMEEVEVAHDVVEAASICRTFSPGQKFTVNKHHCKAEEGKSFVLITVEHSASEGGSYVTSLGAGAEYGNTFTCIPTTTVFRPARITQKPIVQGVQPAVVVGPGGEEIYTDKYGRVKVQFFWDRKGNKDDKSSCWVRASQPWAGQNWGGIAIPRIGQEVLVEFIEGDPDRPIITGRVYNAEQMPPYDLPANMTQTGIKTRSSKGGSGANFNEIRFEDKKGSEQLFIHAEKNQDIEVENDETHWVGHDRKKTIDNDETTQVKHDRTETVDHDETITVHNNRTERVDKDEKISIGENRTEDVGKDEKITISGNRTEDVSKDEKITISGNRTEDVTKDEKITIGSNRTESVGKKEDVTVGDDRTVTVNQNDSLNVSKKLTIDAGDEITIKTGSASIRMMKDGTIQIEGKDISIQGSGKITAEADGDMTLKGSKIAAN